MTPEGDEDVSGIPDKRGPESRIRDALTGELSL